MKVIVGDLLAFAKEGKFDVIVHGCNCFNTMGAGIALQISKQYPQAAAADKETTAADRYKLGTYTQADAGAFKIINAYTQFGFASGNEDVFEYTAFSEILTKLAKEFPTSRFGFPLIGMGLAGGSSVKITAMLKAFGQIIEAKGGSVTIVEFGQPNQNMELELTADKSPQALGDQLLSNKVASLYQVPATIDTGRYLHHARSAPTWEPNLVWLHENSAACFDLAVKYSIDIAHYRDSGMVSAVAYDEACQVREVVVEYDEYLTQAGIPDPVAATRLAILLVLVAFKMPGTPVSLKEVT